MEIAVVILNWNGKEHLATYLPSVIEHTQNARIYVADNASTDDSIAFLNEKYPQIKQIHNSENGGFAKGYNDALKSIQADYYVLLNSDVEVSKNWVETTIKHMEEQKALIAQPKILSYQHKDHFEYAGAAGGFIDYLGYPFCRGRIFQSMEKDHGQYDDVVEVFWATGACMFIKADLFHELGGFDERYFAHMEEIDLCWRAKNKGHKVLYVGKSHVYHLGGGTMQNSNPKKTFLNFRNSLLTLNKNDQSKFTAIKILLRLLLDGLAFVKILIDNGFSHALSIPQAHFSYYKMKKKHKRVPTPNLTGMYHKSIVLQHFLFKIQRYSELKKG